MPRSVPVLHLELRGIARGSQMRLPLEGAEVWHGLRLLGVVSGEWLAQQIQERLQVIAATEWLKAELGADPGRALGPLPPRVIALPQPVTPALKAARRQARKQRPGRRPRPPA